MHRLEVDGPEEARYPPDGQHRRLLSGESERGCSGNNLTYNHAML